jgi:hypothetical protein
MSHLWDIALGLVVISNVHRHEHRRSLSLFRKDSYDAPHKVSQTQWHQGSVLPLYAGRRRRVCGRSGMAAGRLLRRRHSRHL